MSIRVIDDFLADPEDYRLAALQRLYHSFHFEHCTFHGISPTDAESEFVKNLLTDFPELEAPTTTFFRRSPLGQVEPHYIHSDIDMGQWSAILYLNPNPPEDDGTKFWTHRETGTFESMIPHERSVEGREPEKYFDVREHVKAKFNRLLFFPSSYFHSRAIPENWGDQAEARLTQVAFGRFKS